MSVTVCICNQQLINTSICRTYTTEFNLHDWNC